MTATTAAAGNFYDAKRRAMSHDRNLFHRRLHRFRHFDNSFERRIGGHDPLEQIAEDAFYFAVDQIIDIEFIQAFGAFELPCAGTANHDLRPVFCDNRMFDDFEKLGGVQRNQVLAGNLRIDIGGVGNPQRVMSMNGQDLRLRPDKLLEILPVTDDYVFLLIFPQQQRLDHAQAVGDILRAAVRP